LCPSKVTSLACDKDVKFTAAIATSLQQSQMQCKECNSASIHSILSIELNSIVDFGLHRLIPSLDGETLQKHKLNND